MIAAVSTLSREAAFIPLWSSYSGYCYRIARDILKNHLDAEECVNEAFFQLWLHLEQEAPRNLKSFLGAITRNIAINQIRSRCAAKRGGADSDLQLFDTLPAAPGNLEEEFGLRDSILRSTETVLSSRTPEDREAFFLRYVEGESIEAIAARLGLSRSCVKARLFRIRKALRAELEKAGVDV